jgi:hypothetical protein
MNIIDRSQREIRSRRADRAQRKQLERELSTYTTAAELDDLNAMIARYDDAQVADVRRILDKVRAA